MGEGFLRACPNIESFTLGKYSNGPRLLRHVVFSKFRRLKIDQCEVVYKDFVRFLVAYINTLESITCAGVNLAVTEGMLSMTIDDDYPNKDTSQSWFRVFSFMLNNMPQLQSVSLSDLSHVMIGPPSVPRPVGNDMYDHESPALDIGAVRSLTACGGDEVAQFLQHAIDEAVTTENMYQWIRQTKVWFPKPEQAKAIQDMLWPSKSALSTKRHLT